MENDKYDKEKNEFMCVKKTDELISLSDNTDKLIELVYKDFIFLSSDDVKWYKKHKSEEYLNIIIFQRGTLKKVTRSDFVGNGRDPIRGMSDKDLVLSEVDIKNSYIVFKFKQVISKGATEQLKYRIWHCEDEKFLPTDSSHGDKFYFIDGYGNIKFVREVLYSKNYKIIDMKDECVVNRFTGFKDSIGSKIFVNDFVMVKSNIGDVSYHQVVENIHKGREICDLIPRIVANMNSLKFAINADDWRVDVCGNIHQQPEGYHEIGFDKDE